MTAHTTAVLSAEAAVLEDRISEREDSGVIAWGAARAGVGEG